MSPFISPSNTAVPSADMFLATTAEESCWDKSKKIVFLGEWCRRFSKAESWEALETETLPDPWVDPAVRQAAYEDIGRIYERLLPRLGDALNELHGEKHGLRYWRLTVGHWLYEYISVLYDRHATLLGALELHPGISTVILAQSGMVVPRSSYDFIRLLLTETYNLQIYTRILGAIGQDAHPQITLPPPQALPVPAKHGASPKFRAFARSLIGGTLNALGRGRLILHDSFFSRAFELQLAVKTKGRVLPCMTIAGDGRAPISNPSSRHKLGELLSDADGFESVLVKLLPHDIPTCYVEGYTATTEETKRYPKSPCAIFSANSWAYDEVFKQWAGRCSEHGTRLIGAQHGGGYYGISTYFFYIHWELSIVDHYFSWGWRPNGNDATKVQPMCATLLSGKPQIPPDNRKFGILYVGTAEPRYLHTMQFLTGHFIQYLDWQAKFLQASPDAIRDALVVRLYPEEYGWDIRARWEAIAPTTAFDDTTRPFLDSLKSCRLYVSDHLGTTFYQSMAANRPTILFFNPDFNPLLPEAQKAFDNLRHAGIVFDTPEDAVAAISLCYKDVEGWWNASGIQAARIAFCAGYARTSSTAIDDFAREFSREI